MSSSGVLDVSPRYIESGQHSSGSIAEQANANTALANPLNGLSHHKLMYNGEKFAKFNGMGYLSELFQKGAVLAQNPTSFEDLPFLTQMEKNILRQEFSNKWKHPKMLYYLVILCSVAAAVQGMDETVINGANLFFAQQFGIDPNDGNTNRNQWLLGLVNSAPYLCCAFLGYWLTDPLNRAFGRRGTTFIMATLSFVTCIWQGLTNSWPHLFVARFVLGLGIGPKTSTVPVYAAECALPAIRGALVTMWQTWTAFGIMLGFVSDLIFFKVPDGPRVRGLNWRLMLGSAGVPALLIMLQVFLCPESPRWYVSKGRYDKAFESLSRLRESPLQAARDLHYMHALLEVEKAIHKDQNRFLELFKIPRNRRAALASFIVMFMQQFCGVNVIAYYSSNIFIEAYFTRIQALLASFGFGVINFLFTFPAIYLIDTFGRRNLLLCALPLMAIFLLMTGFAFWIPSDSTAHIVVIAFGIYLFGMAYSSGQGPVPFTYSAEAFPLHVRDIGMSAATATLWFFNFLISITFPRLLGAFKPQGAFSWYAAWNIVGFIAVLFFVPETKALLLEELDQVFSVPTHIHATYRFKNFSNMFKKYVLRRNIVDLPPLYDHQAAVEDGKLY